MTYLIGVLCMSAGFGFGWAVRARMTEVRYVEAQLERVAIRRGLAVDNDAIDWGRAS